MYTICQCETTPPRIREDIQIFSDEFFQFVKAALCQCYSFRPLKLNNEFLVTRVCYVLKMAETLIIFIQMLIISI